MAELIEHDFQDLLRDWERTEDETRINFTKSVDEKLILISMIRSIGDDQIIDIEVSYVISDYKLHWHKIRERISAKDFVKILINNGWEEHRFFYRDRHYKTVFLIKGEINNKPVSIKTEDSITEKRGNWSNLIYYLADKGLLFNATVEKKVIRVKI